MHTAPCGFHESHLIGSSSYNRGRIWTHFLRIFQIHASPLCASQGGSCYDTPCRNPCMGTCPPLVEEEGYWLDLPPPGGRRFQGRTRPRRPHRYWPMSHLQNNLLVEACNMHTLWNTVHGKNQIKCTYLRESYHSSGLCQGPLQLLTKM